jgi:hypothetical protein
LEQIEQLFREYGYPEESISRLIKEYGSLSYEEVEKRIMPFKDMMADQS